MSEKTDNDNLLSVVTMLGDAIDKLNNLSVYKPKERKKLWKYAFYNKRDGNWYETQGYFSSGKEVTAIDAYYQQCKRIDSSMIEVDDD